MGIIPQGISVLSETILSYLITALTILAIVKLIQMIMSMGGGKGLSGLFGGGKGGKDTTTKPNTTNDPKDPKDPKTKKNPADKTADKVGKDHFNPYDPGKVKFLVVDEDDSPLQGATITVKPKYASKNKYALIPSIKWAAWTRNKDTWRDYGPYRTNADGYAPSRNTYAQIGSGVVTITTIHNRFIFPKEHIHPSFEIKGNNEEQLIIITMKGKGEKDEKILPFIHDIDKGTGKLKLIGEVK